MSSLSDVNLGDANGLTASHDSRAMAMENRRATTPERVSTTLPAH
jgi:hypothetical protein